jgi:hypothetical protein
MCFTLTFLLFCCAANCMLRSVRASDVDACKSRRNGKWVVSADVAAVWALADQVIPANAELLLDYGGASFWSPSFVSSEHCAECFSRDASQDNPLVQCEGVQDDDSMCMVSRHRYCFRNSDMPSLADLAKPHVRFFCPNHMHQGSPAIASPLRPHPEASTPARHIQFTPPIPFASSVAADSTSTASRSAAAALLLPFTPPVTVHSMSEFPRPSMTAQAQSVVRSILFNSAPTRPAGSSLPIMRKPHVVYSISETRSSDLRSEPAAAKDDQISDGSSCSSGWHHDTSDKQSHSSAAPSSPSSQATAASRVSHRPGAKRTAGVTASMITASDSGKQQAGEELPTLSIRKTREECLAKLGEKYQSNDVPVSVQQVQLIQRALDIYIARKPRPWFIPKPKAKSDEVTATQSSAASAAPAAPALSLRRTHAASVGSGADALVASSMKGVTKNRWLSVTQHLQHDWAEYRACCCGSPLHLAGLSHQQLADHTSSSVVKFFEARLKYHDRVSDSKAFRDLLRNALAEIVDNRLPWMSSTVCLSCFRAILGRGHDFFFQARKAPDVGERAANLDITARGELRKARAAHKRDPVF